jgi:hypothetical protein
MLCLNLKLNEFLKETVGFETVFVGLESRVNAPREVFFEGERDTRGGYTSVPSLLLSAIEDDKSRLFAV